MIVGFYAGLLALFYIYLSMNVIRERRKHQVTLLDNNILSLRRAIRVHANFSEYVPFALLLLFLLERQAWNFVIIHILCLLLLIGRLLHAYGVRQINENYRFRILAMLMTFACIGISAFLLIFTSL